MEVQKVSKENQRLSKKAAIFKAALRIFMEKGYEETRIIDIAKEAGIGKGTVYEYFSSKEALFFEMFCERMLDHSRDAVRIRGLKAGPEAKLKAYLELEFDHIKNCQLNKDEEKKISLDVILGKALIKNEKVSMQIQTMMENRLGLLVDIIKEGIGQKSFRQQDPYLAAISVLGAISFNIGWLHGMFPKERFPDTESDGEKVQEALYQFILKGLSG